MNNSITVQSDKIKTREVINTLDFTLAYHNKVLLWRPEEKEDYWIFCHHCNLECWSLDAYGVFSVLLENADNE